LVEPPQQSAIVASLEYFSFEMSTSLAHIIFISSLSMSLAVAEVVLAM